MPYDFLIVGSGLTGATIARILTDSGQKVLVLDRRPHLGGNVHDHHHESGIRIHTYGPHYFRTSSEEIWQFVKRFTSFYPYCAAIKSWVDGSYENWPIAASYIRRAIGEDWKVSFEGVPSNFEEAALKLMPLKVYEKFIKGYNTKQWGVNPSQLAPTLIKRFDVRADDDPRLMPHHKYQGIPSDGYAKMMEKMLEGIPVMLNVDYLKHSSAFKTPKKLIYTGPIDAYFGFDLGRLHYRGQQRIHEYLPEKDWAQPCGQVNNPQMENGPHIRTLEWKHMMPPEYAQQIKGTVLTQEITHSPDDPEQYEYPFPDRTNQELYNRYAQRASLDANLLICGRLGEYRYYDMDQAIGRAMKLAMSILNNQGGQWNA